MPFFVLALAYGLLLGLGLPLWDDDYTSWLRPAMGKSYLQILWEIASPVSTQSHTWGFNERPWELLYYKLGYSVSGYSSWSYWLFKSLGLGVMIWAFHRWALELTPSTRWGRLAAGGSAVLLLFAPCTAAAFVWHADFEPIASAWFLLCARAVWRSVASDERSVKRWMLLILLTYLGYKTKAGLKLLPAVAGVYALLCGRWKMLLPISVMALLALPWSSTVFRTPPFLSQTESGLPQWMWQFPSTRLLEAFFWNSEFGTVEAWLNEPTLSLFGVLGVLSLLPLAFVALPSRVREESEGGAPFIALWALAAIVAVTVLPELTYFFRIRYGLILLVPVALLVAWMMGRMEAMGRPMLVGVGIALLLQTGVNLHRSLIFRARLGTVIAAVDRAYTRVAELAPNGSLLLRGVLRYDWHPDAPPIIQGRTEIGDWRQTLNRKGAYVLSWESPPADLRLHEEVFSRGGTLFDAVYPWGGDDPLYLSQVPQDL